MSNATWIRAGLVGIATAMSLGAPGWAADKAPGSSRGKQPSEQRSDTAHQDRAQTRQDSQSSAGSSLHTGSDLTGGRDSHLGPQQDAEQNQGGKTSRQSRR